MLPLCFTLGVLLLIVLIREYILPLLSFCLLHFSSNCVASVCLFPPSLMKINALLVFYLVFRLFLTLPSCILLSLLYVFNPPPLPPFLPPFLYLPRCPLRYSSNTSIFPFFKNSSILSPTLFPTPGSFLAASLDWMGCVASRTDFPAF